MCIFVLLWRARPNTYTPVFSQQHIEQLYYFFKLATFIKQFVFVVRELSSCTRLSLSPLCYQQLWLSSCKWRFERGTLENTGSAVDGIFWKPLPVEWLSCQRTCILLLLASLTSAFPATPFLLYLMENNCWEKENDWKRSWEGKRGSKWRRP